jgi:phosphatidylserine/phosphatidylglycerophosphate/cardiolipin synthase-like enzyme
MNQNSRAKGVSLRSAFASLVAWLTLVGIPCAAASITNGQTGELPSVVRWTNSSPSAFAQDDRLRLYFTNEGFAFDAEWKQSRVAVEEFSYATATVKRDKSPPALPSGKSDWQPVKMLGMAECERLLQVAATRLAPTNAGHGLYVQYSLGDVVVFRDATGETRIVPFDQRPAQMIIDRRYGRQEALSDVARTVEADLRSAYPAEKRFAVIWSRRQPRILYLDLERRQSVVLYVPRESNPDRPKLGKNLKTLASFAVVDNGWSFLKNPISSATRTIHQALQWTATLWQPVLRSRGSTVPPVATNAPGMDLVAWEKWLDRYIGTPRERGAIRLLVNGEKFFPHFERRLAEAQSNINIHVCIFDRDDVAVQVADLLKARSTNVEVKVIYDRLNSNGAGGTPPATPMPVGFVPPRSIKNYLREASEVKVHPQLNPGFTCDHSKVFLIDQRYAFMGGMNFGREYRYEWHDLMAEVEGPVVASIQNQFDKKWAQTGWWGDLGLAAAAIRDQAAPLAAEPPDSIELRRLYTKTFDRQIRSAQLEAVSRARNHIFLENAYLYSNDLILALVRARQRGVDVRVIMPGENDFESGHSSNLVTANYLRQHGVRVYFYPGMSHVKALLVDGWVCFGSANCDALSLRLNREGNIATSDPNFAATFRREVFDVDMAKARELSNDVTAGFGDHFSDALLNPF